MHGFTKIPVYVFIVGAFAACGDGGESVSGENSNSLANINFEETSAMAILAAKNSLSETPEISVPFINLDAQFTSGEQIAVSDRALGKLTLDSSSNESALDGTLDCLESGHFSYDFPFDLQSDSDFELLPQEGEAEFQFDMCANTPEVTLDGEFDISWTGGWNQDYVPQYLRINADLNVFYLDEAPISYEGIVECENYGEHCEESSRFVVDDSVKYEISEAQVSGNESVGYDISATITADNKPEIQISGNDLILCEEGNFFSGSIDVLDGNGVLLYTIEFIDCDEFIITGDV